MKLKRWLFILLFLFPSLCLGAAVDYKVDNLGNIYGYSLYIGNTLNSIASGSLFKSGITISDLAPRTADTTLNVSRLNPDTTTDGLLSMGFEAIVKSPATSKQALIALSTGLYNYGNTGAVYGSGFGIGIWNHSEAHGTGTTWSIATEVYDSVGNADIIGHEIIVGRTASSVKASRGLQLIADGNQPLEKALTIEQMDDPPATATWAKGLYAEQSAIGTGASDSFIELKDQFRVKRDGDIIVKGPWIDVRAYGAKGDRTTDDTTAIQNALNAAALTPLEIIVGTSQYAYSKVVYAPRGVYRTTAKLTLPYGVWLVADGSTNTAFDPDMDASTDFLDLQQTSLPTEANGYCKGGLVGFKVLGSPTKVRDILHFDKHEMYVSDVIVRGAGRYGIYADLGIHTLFDNIQAISNVSAGAYVTATSSINTTTTFRNSYFGNTTDGPGVHIVKGLGIRLENCTFESNGAGTSTTGYGIRIQQGDVTLVAPYFENNTKEDIYAGETDDVALVVVNPKILGGGYSDATVGSIYINHSDYVHVTGGLLGSGRLAPLVYTANSSNIYLWTELISSPVKDDGTYGTFPGFFHNYYRADLNFGAYPQLLGNPILGGTRVGHYPTCTFPTANKDYINKTGIGTGTSVVGDAVMISFGTGASAGFYRITALISANSVQVNKNIHNSGTDITDGIIDIYHNVVVVEDGAVSIGKYDTKKELSIGDDIWELNDSTVRLTMGNTTYNVAFRQGQSTTAFGYMQWVYNATENNSYLNFQSYPITNKGIIFQQGGGNIGFGFNTPLSKVAIDGGLHVGGASDAGDNNLLVDGTAIFTGGFGANTSMGGYKITSLGTPTDATDGATKGYVDALGSGLHVKYQVRLATAAVLPNCTAAGHEVNKTLTADAVGVLTVDGVATVLNDRILVKTQATGADKGIYKVTTEGTAGVAFVLTRATDADTDAEVLTGMYCFVTAGTANTGTGWVVTTLPTIELDVTSLSFALFSSSTSFGTGVAGQVAYWSGTQTITGDTDMTFSGTRLTVTDLTVTNGPTISSLTASKPVFSDGSKNLVSMDTLTSHYFLVTVPGYLTASSNIYPAIIIPDTATVYKLYARVRTAPTGAGIVIDVKKNGSSIWSNPVNRLTIAAGAYSATTSTFTTSSFAEGDYIEIDIISTGSTVSGSDLSIGLRFI